MRNSDVTELQARLTAEGHYNGPVTGFFGPLTHAAVISYQTAHNIQPNIGYVGILTRTALNEGSQAPQLQVAAAVGGAELSGQIQSQIDVLLQMIRDLQARLLTQ
jgi:peptidoglycan hydrolase-like protein with peptidoglycan-binding domain